jgi:porphobilinogen synthase
MVSKLTPKQLTSLLIVCESEQDMPQGILRFQTVGELEKEARRLASLGIGNCKLYVKTKGEQKDKLASAGLEKNNLMVRAIKAIKSAVPDMIVSTEVCACSYHSSGECVLVDENGVNDKNTHALVGKMAVMHADAGADLVVAGLTHDGSVRAMRKALDNSDYTNVSVMGSVQLKTGYYAPFRSMMGTEPEAGETFRSHIPAEDVDAVIKRAEKLIDEGADTLSIQPALIGIPLITRLKECISVPLAAFSVSTELNLVRGDSSELWLAKGCESILSEYYLTLLNAGADQIQTYVAGDLAEWLVTQ